MEPEVRKILIRYQASRSRILRAGEGTIVTTVLDAASTAIGEAKKDLERQLEGLDDELFQLGYDAELADEYDAIVDELLGSVFTVLQRTINAAAAHAVMCSRLTAENSGKAQRFNHKGEVYAHGSAIVAGKTPAQLINASANYYKHRDEWGDWATLGAQSARTVLVVQSIGMKERASDNMKTAVTSLGGTVDDLGPLLDALASWSKEVQDQLCTDSEIPKFP